MGTPLAAKSCRTRAGGFTLVETLIATSIMAVGLFSTAGLIVLSSRANGSANLTTMTMVLAVEKVEQLRGLAWGFDSSGLPVSDTATDTAVDPEQPVGGAGLAASPPQSLQQNTSGYCDFLDARGRTLGGGSAPPAGTAFIRRWSIAPLQDVGDTLVIQVLVASRSNPGSPGDESADRARRRFPNEARVVTVKTRKAQ